MRAAFGNGEGDLPAWVEAASSSIPSIPKRWKSGLTETLVYSEAVFFVILALLTFLSILLFGVAVRRLQSELGRVDIGEFGTITLATAGKLLLLVVMVGGGKKVVKNQLRDPQVLLVHFDGNTGTVVPDRYGALFSIDLHLQGIQSWVHNLM